MKYLGVLVDENFSWKHHINYISTKISKGIGIIARLRTLGTTHYSSKHLPLAHRTAYFLWSRCLGSSRECSFKQSCHFTKAGSSSNVFFRLYSLTVLLFAFSGILPIKMLYFKLVASKLHDVENHVLLPIFPNFLLALNRFIPTPLASQ